MALVQHSPSNQPEICSWPHHWNLHECRAPGSVTWWSRGPLALLMQLQSAAACVRGTPLVWRLRSLSSGARGHSFFHSCISVTLMHFLACFLATLPKLHECRGVLSGTALDDACAPFLGLSSLPCPALDPARMPRPTRFRMVLSRCRHCSLMRRTPCAWRLRSSALEPAVTAASASSSCTFLCRVLLGHTLFGSRMNAEAPLQDSFDDACVLP